MSNIIRIKKGADIKMEGKAELNVSELADSKFYALKPSDFNGLTPKLSVSAGDKVKAGSPLFYDKYNPNILFTSPVSGTVSSINRGERRVILSVVVEADGNNENETFQKTDPATMSNENILQNILKSGCWPLVKQRPYDVIANPNDKPRDIYVTAFDSSPLAPDYEFVGKEDMVAFQSGITALSKLTEGKVRVGVKSSASIFSKVSNAEVTEFQGPHPAGNIGTQINKTLPINKGDIVWTLNAMSVIVIGRLFETGFYDSSKTIALAGSEVEKPSYFKVKAGANINDIVSGKLKSESTNRIISGNVLTGQQVNTENYLGFYDYEVTVIPEGDEAEFFGWVIPGFKKFSRSRTFLSWLTPNKEYRLTTKMHGGERPFIVSGAFEKVFPFDILPVQLIKAIIINDLDLMEELGIYEVAEEDFALCEVISTSKIEIQKIVRKGLNNMIKEFS